MINQINHFNCFYQREKPVLEMECCQRKVIALWAESRRSFVLWCSSEGDHSSQVSKIRGVKSSPEIDIWAPPESMGERSSKGFHREEKIGRTVCIQSTYSQNRLVLVSLTVYCFFSSISSWCYFFLASLNSLGPFEITHHGTRDICGLHPDSVGW